MAHDAQPSEDPPSREEAIRLLEGGYGEVILKSAASYTAPIFWGDPGAGSILGSGSIFFIECGGPVFAVTCDHVVGGWLDDKVKHPNIICQVLDLIIEPESRIIDRDPELDLATLSFSAEEVAGIDKWVYTRTPDQWPPAPPEKGKGVFFAGFPGQFREQIDPDFWEFGIYTGLGVATRVYDDQIIYQFEREHLVDILGKGIPPENQWLGGLSGAPLWTVTSFGWRLGGVIYEWSQDYELLYARRPEALRCDGTLVRPDDESTKPVPGVAL